MQHGGYGQDWQDGTANKIKFVTYILFQDGILK
jgi:hypothetical protein